VTTIAHAGRKSPGAGGRPRRWRADHGNTTVEAAGYTALMLLAVMVLVQAAVWALADLSARHAADHAAQTTRVAGGTAETGHQAATEMLSAINPNGLTNVDITVDRTAETTTVTITGNALQVIPVVTIPVQVRTLVPTEPDQ
jgi:Flp pilus assembly protein TadG